MSLSIFDRAVSFVLLALGGVMATAITFVGA